MMNPLLRTPWLGAGCLALCVALSGCATRVPPTPATHALHPDALRLPRKVLVTEVAPPSAPMPLAIRHVWQVVVQQEGEALRWLRFDLLGVPDARQILANGRWRNDGFIAPNAAAREMFAALLFAWMEGADLDAAYGVGRWLYRLDSQGRGDAEMNLLTHANDADPRWTVTWPNPGQADTFAILRRKDGMRWDVRPVSEEP